MQAPRLHICSPIEIGTEMLTLLMTILHCDYQVPAVELENDVVSSGMANRKEGRKEARTEEMRSADKRKPTNRE